MPENETCTGGRRLLERQREVLMHNHIIGKIFRFHTWRELEPPSLVCRQWRKIALRVWGETNWASAAWTLDGTNGPVSRMYAALRSQLRLCARPSFGFVFVCGNGDGETICHDLTVHDVYQGLVKWGIVPKNRFHMIGLVSNNGVMHVDKSGRVSSDCRDSWSDSDSEAEMVPLRIAITLGSIEHVRVQPFVTSVNNGVMQLHEKPSPPPLAWEDRVVSGEKEAGVTPPGVPPPSPSEEGSGGGKLRGVVLARPRSCTHHNFSKVFEHLERHNQDIPVFGTAAASKTYLNEKRVDGIVGLTLRGDVEMHVRTTRRLKEIGSRFVLQKGSAPDRIGLLLHTANEMRRCSPYEFMDQEVHELKRSPCVVVRVFEETPGTNQRRKLADVNVLTILAMEVELDVQTRQHQNLLLGLADTVPSRGNQRLFTGRFCVLAPDPSSAHCLKDIQDLKAAVDEKLAIFGLVFSCPLRTLSISGSTHNNGHTTTTQASASASASSSPPPHTNSNSNNNSSSDPHHAELDHVAETDVVARAMPGVPFAGAYCSYPLGSPHVRSPSTSFTEAATCFAVISRRSIPASNSTKEQPYHHHSSSNASTTPAVATGPHARGSSRGIKRKPEEEKASDRTRVASHAKMGRTGAISGPGDRRQQPPPPPPPQQQQQQPQQYPLSSHSEGNRNFHGCIHRRQKRSRQQE